MSVIFFFLLITITSIERCHKVLQLRVVHHAPQINVKKGIYPKFQCQLQLHNGHRERASHRKRTEQHVQSQLKHVADVLSAKAVSSQFGAARDPQLTRAQFKPIIFEANAGCIPRPLVKNSIIVVRAHRADDPNPATAFEYTVGCLPVPAWRIKTKVHMRQLLFCSFFVLSTAPLLTAPRNFARFILPLSTLFTSTMNQAEGKRMVYKRVRERAPPRCGVNRPGCGRSDCPGATGKGECTLPLPERSLHKRTQSMKKTKKTKKQH